MAHPPVDRDFDAIVEGRQRPFTLAGKLWHTPVELPHDVVLWLDRINQQRGADHPLTYDEFLQVARLLYSPEVVDGWLAAGVGPERLAALVEWTIEVLGSGMKGTVPSPPPDPSVTDEGGGQGDPP